MSLMRLLFYCSFFIAFGSVAADEVTRSHAISMFDSETPLYESNFTHFDYVNPDAPKGGTLRLAAQGSFDSFHPFIPKGNAVSTGAVETLLLMSADEPFTGYGLIAESIEWPKDRAWVIFHLRPEARWHDGSPITSEDVTWSYETLVSKGNPQYRFYYGAVSAATALDPLTVRFDFKESNNRELPLIVGQIPILPKNYWSTRDFSATTLTPPLGSGPYQITNFEAGRYIEKVRVKDYWGANLAVRKGLNNFDTIRTTFFRDATPIRLALKAGDIDFRSENQAKAWAEDYNIDVVQTGWLKKELIPHRMPTGMQAFVMNARRNQFADPRAREAVALAFDFEWTNQALFNGQYTRTTSYFSNSELAASGMPENEELKILDTFRDQLPVEVFNEVYTPPVNDGSGYLRNNLRQASRLLRESGWIVKDLKRINEDSGELFQFEILLVTPAFERISLPFIRNLQRLGIEAKVRLIDESQYINRFRQFDFDMIVWVWGQSQTPGNEQLEYWSQAASHTEGSRNLAGIQDPVVDELIALMLRSQSREQLNHRTRALDRVLRWGHYVIPHWHIRADRVLFWDKFGRPDQPVRTGVMTDRWWFDALRADTLKHNKP